MKNHCILFILITGFWNLLSGQTLIDSNIIRGGSVICKTNGLYFEGSDGIIYFLNQSETITSIVPGQLTMEYNGSLYAYDFQSISRISLINNMPTTIFNDPNLSIYSRGITAVNSEYYFVGFGLGETELLLYRLSSSGVIINDYQFPGPIQNTIRIHESNNKVYIFTNTAGPSVEYYYYEFDPIINTIVSISESNYSSSLPTTSIFCATDEVDVNGEVFSIDYGDHFQLTSDLNPVPLTCFELVQGKGGTIAPFILGSIGSRIYLSYYSYASGGSINGIYRYPELANEGLCEEPLCDQDIKPDVHIEDGDVYLEESCRGVVFTTPDGNCYRMTVNNNGDLETTFVTCPN